MFKRKLYYSALILLVLLPPWTLAQTVRRNIEKEQKIWQGLQAVAPDMVETFKEATVALDKQDYAQAAQLYEAVYKKAPDYDPSMRRLGLAMALSGHRAEGLALLEAAATKNPSPENLISVAQILDEPHDGVQPSQEELLRAFTYSRVAADLYKGGSDPTFLTMWAKVSLELQRTDGVRKAVIRLKNEYPDLLLTHYYSAIVAASDDDWATAEVEIKQAEALGLPASVGESVLAARSRIYGMIWRYVYYGLFVVGAWLIGLELLFVLGRRFSKSMLRWLETSDPNAAASGGARLRKYYRWLINMAGAYYSLSLPILLFLIAGTTGITLYGVSKHMPLKIVLPIITGTLLIVYSLMRSLRVRTESEVPGRPLSEIEAPALWALTREVAQAVGTQPIDEIRITPAADMAVYECGSFRKRIKGRARRVLVLGVYSLDGFEQNAFRAVLAHEYGHFRHHDTAGADVAIRINEDLAKFTMALTNNGQAVWYNPAFQFLRVYHFIFRRISHGATRLQEVMADRVAVINYSPQALEEGLRHVIRRKVEFEDIDSFEVNGAAEAQRPLQHLYELPDSKESRIQEKIDKVITQRASEDDRHPVIAERFRLASHVAFTGQLPPSGLVWNLFADRAALTAEMNQIIHRGAAAA